MAQNRILVSPLAKKIAQQKNIDLSSIMGTGPSGRIVKADILSFSEKKAGAPAAISASRPGPTSSIDAAALSDALGVEYDKMPNGQVRKIIASRLLEAKQTIPHFYLTVDCCLDELLELRQKINNNAADPAAKISVNDFVIKASACAMRDVPGVNASWSEEAIIQYKSIDISVAVATPNGLITPVIRQAGQKSLSQISSQMKDLAQRAKDNKLKPEEFQGGGFTISNLGMYGITSFSAIINPPQSCILAVGAGEERAVVRNGKIEIAQMMTCTLSVDHRSVDGALGALFLKAFKKYIENPSLALV